MSNSRIPKELKYTKEHEWAKIEGDSAKIGITDFAQSQLGDIVFVDLPEVGSTLSLNTPFGAVESIKSVSDLYAPLSGEILEVNKVLEDSPEDLNADAYKAWMVKIKISNFSELEQLLSAEDYQGLVS